MKNVIAAVTIRMLASSHNLRGSDLRGVAIIDGLNEQASSHDTCLHSATETGDNLRLGRVRIAAAENCYMRPKFGLYSSHIR